MIKRIILTLAYFLLLALSIAQGVFFYLKLGKIEQNITAIQTSLPQPLSDDNLHLNKNIPTLQPNNSEGTNLPNSTSNLTGGTTTEQATKQIGGGDLLKHNTYLAVSTGPTDFSPAAEPIFTSASVPEVVKLNNGDLLLYFVDAATLITPGTERLAYSKSIDSGKTWSTKQHIVITGKTNAGAVVDPSVVELSDGTLRMYFFGSETTQGDPAATEGDHVVYSAVSSDGLNWTVEDGERFAAARLTDPEVVQMDDHYWLMYYSLGTTTGIATSSDGLEWFESKQSWAGGGVPGAYLDADRTVHLYGCSPSGLMTADSTDGTTFMGGVAVFKEQASVCDPSPALLDDGQVLLIYKQID